MCTLTPRAPPPIATTSRCSIEASAITGHAPQRPERRDRAALVARDRPRLVGVGQAQPVGAEVRAQLRPVEPPAARDQHEQVVVGRAPDEDRAQQRPELDALERRPISSALRAISVRTTRNGTPAARARRWPGSWGSSMAASRARVRFSGGRSGSAIGCR